MIKVYGPGLESGVFPDYKGYFFVDATGAGGGELHVSVMGLKGKYRRFMVVPTKSDSDVIFCLRLLSKTLTCMLHLS